MSEDIHVKPADSQWTDDQWNAIVSSGQDILVAAAAGSGKTAVLVERIIKKITMGDEPIDVDRLLVATFTNASAAEMRNRIGEALEKELKKNPSSLHLRRQLNLLNRASISTLHSFCLEVIRTYYYLIDRYTSDRNDLDIQLMVRKLYDFARSNPDPNGWLEMIVSQYDVTEDSSIDSLPFLSFLLQEVTTQLMGIESILKQGLELTKLPGGPAPRAVNAEGDLAQIHRLISASKHSFADLHEEMQNLNFTRLKPCKGEAYDSQLLDDFGELRKKAKTSLEKLHADLFSRPLHGYMADFEKMKPVIETLIFLVQRFGERYEHMKKEKGLVDFSDLEHYCLQILSVKEDGVLKPSSIAQKYRTQFEEVLVDEYQDTNMVQET